MRLAARGNDRPGTHNKVFPGGHHTLACKGLSSNHPKILPQLHLDGVRLPRPRRALDEGEGQGRRRHRPVSIRTAASQVTGRHLLR